MDNNSTASPESSASSPTSPTTSPSLLSALRNRNLRLLWLGETTSQLGDQFYLIGIPLLVFALTGSSAQLGLILLVEGVPRAGLMLFGGVITDRVSPQRVMLFSNVSRLILTGFLAILILSQAVQLWMLYIIAFFFGAVDAFFQPALMAMVPTIVDPDHLQVSNSLVQSSNQAVQSIGPGLAGAIITGLGIGGAVLLDAFTFLFTTIALLAMHLPTAQANSPTQGIAHKSAAPQAILSELGEMIRFVLQDKALRPYMLYILVINLTIAGPLTVGVPVLAQFRFDGSSAALGLLYSSTGVGAVLGALLSGWFKVKRFGVLFISLEFGTALCLILLGITVPLWGLAVLFGLMGSILGFGNVILLTWFGKQIPSDMIGRFMGLYVFLGVGLAPISNAITGFTYSFTVTGTFIGAGIILAVASMFAFFNPMLRGMEL